MGSSPSRGIQPIFCEEYVEREKRKKMPIYLYVAQKLPRKAKVALGCSHYKNVAQNAKHFSKVAEHNLFMPSVGHSNVDEFQDYSGRKY